MGYLDKVKAYNSTIDAVAGSIVDSDAFAEGAAIVEANGIPRVWAETFAKRTTLPRPTSITPQRWQQIVDDSGRFLDAWGRQAASLGWDAGNCFHPVHGFVALIEGGEVRAITQDSAAIYRLTTTQKQMVHCRYLAFAEEQAASWRVWTADCEPIDKSKRCP